MVDGGRINVPGTSVPCLSGPLSLVPLSVPLPQRCFRSARGWRWDTGGREREGIRPSGCPVFACFCLDISSSYKPQPPLIALSAGLLPPLLPLLLEPHDPFPSYALSIFRIDYTTTPLASPPYTRPAPSSSASSSCIRPRPGRFRGLATGEHARKRFSLDERNGQPGMQRATLPLPLWLSRWLQTTIRSILTVAHAFPHYRARTRSISGVESLSLAAPGSSANLIHRRPAADPKPTSTSQPVPRPNAPEWFLAVVSSPTPLVLARSDASGFVPGGWRLLARCIARWPAQCRSAGRAFPPSAALDAVLWVSWWES